MSPDERPAGQPGAAADPAAVTPAERGAYRRAIAATAVLGSAALVAAAIAWFVASPATGAAVATGAIVGAGFGLVSQVATLRAAGSPAHVFGAVVAGAWLGKMVVLVIALAVIARIDGFERVPFGITVMVLALATVLIDLWAVRSARVPYVSTSSKTTPQ